MGCLLGKRAHLIEFKLLSGHKDRSARGEIVLLAGIARTAPIICSSIRLSCESKAFDGVAMLPTGGAAALPVPICAVAASEHILNTQQEAISRGRIPHLVIKCLF